MSCAWLDAVSDPARSWLGTPPAAYTVIPSNSSGAATVTTTAHTASSSSGVVPGVTGCSSRRRVRERCTSCTNSTSSAPSATK
ncbi:MAG: hypothetical protein PGN11_03370 [Quadrisphaera sp.]